MELGPGRNEAHVRFDAEPGQELGLDFACEFFDKPDGIGEQVVGDFNGNHNAPLGSGEGEGLPAALVRARTPAIWPS